ncbi:MAG: outer membrane beta-barrel protein [Candidatus Aminicenantes bacterium]|nr:outer membrane beta-barrel protein [Candidatus Aminicenantes bacterium]
MTIKKTAWAFISLLLIAVLFFPTPARAAGVKIKLYGGYGYLLGGDLNSGTEGLSNIWMDPLRGAGYTIDGSFQPAHLGLNFGGDVIVMFNSVMGLGFGADSLKASKDSTITATYGMTSLRSILKTEASAIPLKVSLYFCIPAGAGFSMNLHFGAGYYMAKMSNSVRFEEGAGFLEYANTAKANGIGFHGGLGFEFDLSANIGLFIEAQGRYAKLGGFKGDSNIMSNYDTEHESGTLYYFEEEGWIPQFYPVILVQATAPTPDPWVRNIREAKIDFSGGTVLGGIVFRF